MHELLVTSVNLIAPWVEAVGIIVVLWGAADALLKLLSRLRLAFDPNAKIFSLGQIRLAIGERIALGLDFFLVGDIIQTIVIPSWETLAMLGGIVVIRTVIAFFLERDLHQLRAK